MWWICVAHLCVPKGALMAHKTDASHCHPTYLPVTQSDWRPLIIWTQEHTNAYLTPKTDTALHWTLSDVVRLSPIITSIFPYIFESISMHASFTTISKVTKIYLAFVTQLSVIYDDRQIENSSESDWGVTCVDLIRYVERRRNLL